MEFHTLHGLVGRKLATSTLLVTGRKRKRGEIIWIKNHELSPFKTKSYMNGYFWNPYRDTCTSQDKYFLKRGVICKMSFCIGGGIVHAIPTARRRKMNYLESLAMSVKRR